MERDDMNEEENEAPEATTEELQAQLAELQAQLAATPGAATIEDEPKWGEAITIGSIGGGPVRVQSPLNDAALKAMAPAGQVALALHARLQIMEKFIQQLARMEAARQAATTSQVASSSKAAAPKAATPGAEHPKVAAAKKKTTRKRTSKKKK